MQRVASGWRFASGVPFDLIALRQKIQLLIRRARVRNLALTAKKRTSTSTEMFLRFRWM